MANEDGLATDAIFLEKDKKAASEDTKCRFGSVLTLVTRLFDYRQKAL